MGSRIEAPSVQIVAVGQTELLHDGRQAIKTAFRKRPVAEGADVEQLGLVGDAQADLTVHGGPEQAVYAYPLEHYAPWSRDLGRPVEPPAFGENLVTTGILENALNIGDRLRVGTAELEVTQPRMPCRKLAVVHKDRMMTRIFAQLPRPGFYLRVLTPGRIEPGDAIELERAESDVSVLDVYLLRTGARWDESLARRAVELPWLGSSARFGLERKLGQDFSTNQSA